jgi:hypothetical protein
MQIYADPDPAYHFDAYPDPACQFDADPDPDPTFHFEWIRIRIRNVGSATPDQEGYETTLLIPDW